MTSCNRKVQGPQHHPHSSAYSWLPCSLELGSFMYRPPRSPEHRPRPRSRSPPPRGYDRAGAWDKDRDSRWQHDRGWDRAGNARHPSRTWGRERSVSPRERDRPVSSGLSRRSPATSASGALPGRSPIARDRHESTSGSAQQSPQRPVAGWQEGHHGDNSRPLSSGKSGRASLTSSLPVAKELDDFARYGLMYERH